MKTLSTETQAGLFAAAGAAVDALKRNAPAETKALAAMAFVISTVAPTWEELTEWQRSAGLPTIDRASYEEAVQGAGYYALAAFGAGETKH